jgi:hypothetical protein
MAANEGLMPPCPNCGVTAWEWVIVQPVCDFCSDPLPLDGECWTFPCESFQYPFIAIEGSTMQTEGSAEGWAACDVCYALVEAEDRTGLALRSVEKDIERHPNAASERPVLIAMTRAMQDKFFEHRNGEASKAPVKEEGGKAK